MIHMRIVQENKLIADLPSWDGPIPRNGDYIFHPPFGDQDVTPNLGTSIAGCVKTVTWRTHDRKGGKFVQTAHPYVEIVI